jgi:hypothetical protein
VIKDRFLSVHLVDAAKTLGEAYGEVVAEHDRARAIVAGAGRGLGQMPEDAAPL